MPTNIQPKSVIIAGGSLASLMHATVLLSSASPPSNLLILERSPTNLLHNQGAGIVAGPPVQAFFTKYFPTLNASSAGPGQDIVIRSRLRQYLNHEGGIVDGSVDEREQKMTSWDLLYHVLRWRVEGLESGYVKSLIKEGRQKPSTNIEYRNGCIVTAIEDAPSDQVKVTWSTQEGGSESSTVDLLLGADGASSTVRRLLMPTKVERTYCGYVAWRGTAPENSLSDAAREAFIEKFTFFHGPGTQALGYLIPGHDGTTEPGERLFNWVWYVNYQDGSPELEELMTDKNGRRHAITLPVGGMQDKVWEDMKVYAKKTLPPQYAEAVEKTKQPFIQAITDVICPENSFLDGKVLLVGDALAGFRPHTAASTGQAAYDALQFADLLDAKTDVKEYTQLVMKFARETQESGVIMGERSQFGKHPFAG